MSDLRALISRMADELNHYRQLLTDDRREVHPLAVEARAALAQPEPEVVGELTDQELLRCANIATPCYDLKGWERELRMMRAAIAADRARYGRPAPAPAVDCPACEGTPRPGNQPRAVCGRSAPVVDGAEVADLVWWLRSLEDASVWFETGSTEARRLARAADLLERQAAPVPVADDYKVASDKTMRRIRSTTKRWKVTVTITTNDSAIDTRLGVGIWKVLYTENEILESVSLPQLLLSNTELPLPSGEVEA